MQRYTAWLVIVGSVIGAGAARAQPEPGIVYREYLWFNEKGDAGQALRVGGKHGQEHPDRGWAHDYINAVVVLEHDFDLEHAVRAEAVIEKILCHDGTRDLAIEVNGRCWIPVPEAERIPYPPWAYQHHHYPVVPIPLSDLKEGKGNRFRLRVSPDHPWKWPQNLINGVHFRIYYDSGKKSHPTGRITSVADGAVLGRTITLEAKASSSNGPVGRVDYIGLYEDVNYEGDGVYRQWHYRYDHGRLVNHLGTATATPYRVVWDTSWVPDQEDPMEVAARMVDRTGLIYFSPTVKNLKLERAGRSVELCKPFDVPKRWVTRSREGTERFMVQGDLRRARAVQLVWSSWSPGYMNGLYINGQRVFEQEGPRYQAYFHRVTLEEVGCLRPGRNELTTGKTPKYNGKMVHGMEVNWPGIMVLIQYAK